MDHDHDSDGFLDDDACPGGLDCNDTQGAGASVYPGAGCSYGRSCLEAMTVDPGLLGEDAVLMLDPDENGSLTAYYCDFTDDDAYGPGWTLLYYSPFQVAGDNAGWEFWNAQTNAADNGKAVVTTCGQSSILGGYNQTARGWLHRVIDSGLVPHEEIVVDFRFFQLDTWNSENAFLRLERDSAASPGASPADGAFLWYQSIARGTSSLCGQANTIDGSFQITRHIWDSDDVFRLEVGTTLDQTADDESFGIDDVSVWIR